MGDPACLPSHKNEGGRQGTRARLTQQAGASLEAVSKV
jgi:hypothetical protein